MRSLRLTHDNGDDCRLARHCEFFLDGERLDSAVLFVADELAGYIEEGRRFPFSEHGWKWELAERCPKPRPKLYRREGRVTIRLKEDAPEDVRRLYEKRRHESAC